MVPQLKLKGTSDSQYLLSHHSHYSLHLWSMDINTICITVLRNAKFIGSWDSQEYRVVQAKHTAMRLQQVYLKILHCKRKWVQTIRIPNLLLDQHQSTVPQKLHLWSWRWQLRRSDWWLELPAVRLVNYLYYMANMARPISVLLLVSNALR